jgi:phosphoglycolate phosphatase
MDPKGQARAQWDAVLLDLDGTLTDSARAVTGSVAVTLRALGRPVPDDDALLAYVGPPLQVGFRRFAGLAGDDIPRAIATYRKVYEAGQMFDAEVFEGIPRLLDALQRGGFPLALASSKSADHARMILEHFGLDSYFAVVAGAQPDGSGSAKADVIDSAVRGLADLGYSTEEMVMVGDREHDVSGAARWGIPCIVVSWGYGTDIEAEGAHAVVHSVPELARALGVDLEP